jgi:hypothetical protein
MIQDAALRLGGLHLERFEDPLGDLPQRDEQFIQPAVQLL